jgi:hypothetical protein
MMSEKKRVAHTPHSTYNYKFAVFSLHHTHLFMYRRMMQFRKC